MAWIKRNLWFTIVSVIALAFLGGAAYYNYKSWSDNRAAMQQLQAQYNELAKDYSTMAKEGGPSPAPANVKVDNITAARQQQAQLQAWIEQARAYFKPVAPIPNPPDGIVTTPAFAGSLRKTIQDMQVEAKDANVLLPPDYAFTFAAERNLVTFAPGSLNSLASHLGEVKALCEILFDTKINALDGIQREMVSADDAAGPQSDYLADKAAPIGDLAVETPYIISFRCFSEDLGNVLAKMASSDHCFLVKAINVMPAEATGTANGGVPPPGGPMPPPPPTGNEGLQTVLDEQLLRVTMAVEVVKLTK